MKTKLTMGCGLMILALFLTGCAKDGTDGGDSDKQLPGTKNVRIYVTADNARSFRGAAGNQDPTTAENAFDKTALKLFIYDGNGNLELSEQTVALDANNSYEVTITTGYKYFYVFANTGSRSLVAKNTRAEFEQQVYDVTFIDTDADNPDMAGNGDDRNFFMGTLWGVPQDITKDRPLTDPVYVDIGRMTAKVKLYSVVKGNNSNMAGTFSDFSYRMAGVAMKTYLAGQFTGTTPPPTGYTTVTSAVHNEPSEVAGGGANPVFKSYAGWKNVTPLPGTGPDIDNCFYVIENTTAKDAGGKQYFHNTTHVRLKSKYTPHADEIYNADLSSNEGQTLTDGTFWTVVTGGALYITNDVPVGVTPDAGTEIKKYTNGWNYHRFPVQNDDFTNVEVKNSVLRNHYYEIQVTGIRNLGDTDDREDPKEPIPTTVDVTIVVRVVPWSKITQGVEI